MNTPNDYPTLLKSLILNDAEFINAVFSGLVRGETLRWQKVIIRPVLLKNERHLQISYFDERQDITKNYRGAELESALDEVLAMPFRHFNVTTTTELVQVNLSKKGKPAIVRRPATAIPAAPLSHDRVKQKWVAEDVPYLQALGISTHDGKIRAEMRSKLKQMNEFLRLLSETGELEHFEQQPIHVIDFGCGNAYLTLATYHYLTATLGLDVAMVGVDIKHELMERHNQTAQNLGWDSIHFATGYIDEYHPTVPPDIVLALHACDTATDDAILQGVRAGSKLIVCAPCCHHDLQAQLAENPTPPLFSPVMRYGLFHERIGDVLTDSLRALILRIMGYRVDITEFVSPEHTPKNLMIRAVKVGEAGNPQAIAEYRQLIDYWQVKPYLHRALGARFEEILDSRYDV